MTPHETVSVTLAEIQHWLKPIGSLKLQADTAMRVVSFLLKDNMIEHTACRGRVMFRNELRHQQHFWVEIAHESVIDFNLNMYMGPNLGSPKGVVKVPDYPGLQYVREQEMLIGIDALSFGIYTGIPANAYPPASHFAASHKLKSN